MVESNDISQQPTVDVTSRPASGSSGACDTTNHPIPVDALVGQWWVLHTRARNEKALSRELTKANIQFFLPLVVHRRTYAGRVRRVTIPLFPGYVFLCGRPEDRVVALRTNRIAHTLEVPDQDKLRRDLRQIQRVVESDLPIDLYPRLKTGSRCRIVRGTLAGLEGIVLKRRGPWRVYLSVQFLGQSAEVEIDPMLLEVDD